MHGNLTARPSGQPTIDIEVDRILSLRQAAREPLFRNRETGKPAHISKMHRLATRGARSALGARVRLETVMTPGGLATSNEAIRRFFDKLNVRDAAPALASTAATHRCVAEVDRALDAAGIK